MKGKAKQVKGERAAMKWMSEDFFFCLIFSLFRWVHTLGGSSRFATQSGLGTAASWSMCLMTVTWLWQRWKSIPLSWLRTWTQGPARVFATRCPAGVSPTTQRGTDRSAKTLIQTVRPTRMSELPLSMLSKSSTISVTAQDVISAMCCVRKPDGLIICGVTLLEMLFFWMLNKVLFQYRYQNSITGTRIEACPWYPVLHTDICTLLLLFLCPSLVPTRHCDPPLFIKHRVIVCRVSKHTSSVKRRSQHGSKQPLNSYYLWLATTGVRQEHATSSLCSNNQKC